MAFTKVQYHDLAQPDLPFPPEPRIQIWLFEQRRVLIKQRRVLVTEGRIIIGIGLVKNSAFGISTMLSITYLWMAFFLANMGGLYLLKM